jgi:DNA-binding GntR family transcriptional regulator
MSKRTLSCDQLGELKKVVSRRRQLQKLIAELQWERRNLPKQAELAKKWQVPRKAVYRAIWLQYE